MATVNIGNLSFTHKGDYDGSTAYSKNDVVYYSTNGNAYIAKQATTGNVPTNATYWNQFAAGSGGIWNAGLSLGTAGQVVKVNSGASALEFGTADDTYGTKLVHVTSAVQSTTTSNSWAHLPLDTVKTNEVTGASLGSGNLTLPAGTYSSNSFTQFYRVDGYMARLRNITDGVNVIDGNGGHTWSQPNDASTCTSYMLGRFTLSGTKVIQMQYNVSTGNPQTAHNGGHVNHLMVWKVA